MKKTQPTSARATRRLDIVIFGATGFTGGLTAEYLARHADKKLRWALAGRNRDKLVAVRERLVAINPACKRLELLEADVGDAESIRLVAESAAVVITTVGPCSSGNQVPRAHSTIRGSAARSPRSAVLT